MKITKALAAAMPLILVFGIAGCASSPEPVEPDVPTVVEEQPILEPVIEETPVVEEPPVEEIVEEQPPVQEEPVVEETPVVEEQKPTPSDEDLKRAKALQRQIQSARRDAEKAGAKERYRKQFAQAADSAKSSQDYLDGGDVDAALEEGNKALYWFQLLKNLAEVRNFRPTILEYGFDKEEPRRFADAEAKRKDALSNFDSNPEQANKLSQQALEGYKAVYDNGFKRIAQEERERALEAREQCNSIKASRSMPSEYQAAAKALSGAEASGKKGAWEEASKGYRDSSAMFSDVYQSSLYKKNLADEAIRAARARQEASRALALEADKIAPLPDEEEAQPDDAASPPEDARVERESSNRIGAHALRQRASIQN